MNIPSTNPSMEDQALRIKQRLVLENRIRGGANWFFWIAGLSVINSVIQLAGGTFTFIFGLGITQIIDGIMVALARDISPNYTMIVRLIGLAINICIAGIFVAAGILARRQYRWAVVTGTILYILDGLIFIWAAQWLGAAFHALAVLGLVGSLISINRLNQLDKNEGNDPLQSAIAAVQQEEEASNRRSLIRALIIIVVFTCIVVVLMSIYFFTFEK